MINLNIAGEDIVITVFIITVAWVLTTFFKIICDKYENY